MKILLINNCHYRRGGADVVYLNTGKLLEKMGHDVFYFSQKSKDNYNTESSKYFVENIDFFKISAIQKLLLTPRFFFSLEAKKNLEALIKNEKPDIAHIHLYKGTLTPSILITLKKFKIPAVITLHDYGFLCPHNLFIDGKNRICERCINHSALNCIIHKCNRNNLLLSTISAFEYLFHKYFIPFEKYFDRIILPSKFSYEKHARIKKIKHKINHLYNFYPNLNDECINKNIGSYFLFYGRFAEEKGLITLINAWFKVKVKTNLKIVGTGPLSNIVKERIDQAKAKNIEMLGFKYGTELVGLIKNSSFVIVPSEWYENNPLTVIEAYSFGKPVIASNIGGIPEIVKDNITGYLFEMKNVSQMKSIIEKASQISQSEYEQLSINARKFAEENFSEDNHYNKLIEIYSQAISENKLGIN